MNSWLLGTLFAIAWLELIGLIALYVERPYEAVAIWVVLTLTIALQEEWKKKMLEEERGEDSDGI